MKTFSFILILNLFLATNAFAHGEGKLGPNGGYLKMPGTFHTEVVPEKDGSYRVFLIDIQFKNPTIKDSKVELKIQNSKITKVFTCSPMAETHFHCMGKKMSKGKLIVKARRLGIEGSEAIYDLPLKLKESAAGKHDMDNMDMSNMDMGK